MPKELVTVIYRPGHKLFQVAFRAGVDDAALQRLWDTLREGDFGMINSNLFNVEGSEGDWSIFLDCHDISMTAEGLKRILGRLDFIRNLRVTGGEDLIVNSLYFPIVSTAGERTLLISQDSFQRMISMMSEVFGSGGTVISYQEGFAMGSRATGELRTMVKGDLRRFVAEAVKLYTAMGIGTCELVAADFDSMRFTLRVANNIECEGKHSDVPVSQWIRGQICGGASTALQTPMSCIETKCIAKGDRFCEFVLSKTSV